MLFEMHFCTLFCEHCTVHTREHAAYATSTCSKWRYFACVCTTLNDYFFPRMNQSIEETFSPTFILSEKQKSMSPERRLFTPTGRGTSSENGHHRTCLIDWPLLYLPYSTYLHAPVSYIFFLYVCKESLYYSNTNLKKHPLTLQSFSNEGCTLV